MATPEQSALDLFDKYVDMSPKAQLAALEKLRQSDPLLHEALQRLLLADASSHVIDELPLEALANAGLTPAPTESQDLHAQEKRVGSRMGAWQLERLLGVGGMGAVYLARRADGQYEQTAAIKCLRKELTTPALLDAFRNERNLLAKLSHPFIVPILDGGVDQDGSPWFAMQEIQGLPIDQWCDEKKLSLRQRIELFLQASDAVAYAHSQMVVHQDIKPSNLLINLRDKPQLLDFGLSAMLSDGDHENRRIAFSSGYSAPETLDGGSPSAAMDIYSLGVLLYRLLCSDWPKKMRASDLMVTAHSPEPQAPSTLARRAESRVFNPRQCRSADGLAMQIQGDLDAICLKCVATDPAQRYSSVLELQMDLRAWLEKRPISLRQGVRYQFDRFVHRNAMPLALSTAIVLSLGAGLGFTLWQTRRADQEAQSAQIINRMFEDTLGSAAISALGTEQVNSRNLLDATEKKLRDLPPDSNKLILPRGLAALARGYANIGDYTHATELALEARALDTGDPLQSARNASTLASLLNMQSQFVQAEAVVRKALDVLDKSSHREGSRENVMLLHDLARSRWGQGDHERAFGIIQSGLGLARAMGEPGVELEGQLLNLRGSWKTTLLNLDDAEQDLLRSIELTQDDFPFVSDTGHEKLANLYRIMGRTDDAYRIASALVQNRRETMGEDHPETGRAWLALARVHQATNQWHEAHASLANANTILRKSLGPQNPELVGVLIAQSNDLLYLGNDAQASLDLSRQAVFTANRSYGPSHPITILAKANLADKLTYIISTDFAPTTDRYTEAAALYQQVIADTDRHQMPNPVVRLSYAMNLLNMGRANEAEQQIRLATPMVLRRFGKNHTLWLSSQSLSINILVARGKDHEASQQLDALIAQILAREPNRFSQHILMDAFELQGRLAVDRGERNGAHESWNKGLQIASGPSPDSLRASKFKRLIATLPP